MTLLDLIHVMQEQQLGRIVLLSTGVFALLVVQLDRQIPQRDRVVSGRDGNDAVVGRMPFDTCDLFLVEIERGYRRWFRSAG